MITKLLLTVLVIVGMMTYLRRRATAPTPERARPRVGAAGSGSRRLVPAVLLLAALAVGGGMFWLQWQEANRIYTVRVIDTRSGDVRTYLVHRDGVDGRSFQTIDGRRVTLADVERMEVSEGRQAGAGVD